MTAEVAVLNKSAIALAADSKVTITGTAASKTYDTVSKVFTLSKVHPVGVMIFGNAEFMGYPWETIIKAYRSEKKDACEATLEAWAGDFRAFVRGFGDIRKEHRLENAKNIVGSWYQRILESATSAGRKKGLTPTSPDFLALLQQIMKSRITSFVEEGSFFTEAQFKKMMKSLAGIVSEQAGKYFSSFADDDLTKLAVTVGIIALGSSEMSPQMSGIVIAGFGDREYFPSFIEYNFDGYVYDRVKVTQADSAEIERDNPSCVRSFAQADMVQRFMNGVDHQFRVDLQEAFGHTLLEGSMLVLNKYGNKRNQSDKVRKEISEATEASIDTLQKGIDRYLKDVFWRPIIDMVALLPKDELANLAESLVALTSLKRRVSHDAETVGGAVDVALISKGDGFVWVKRKHYFSPDLNPSFNKNYLRGV